MVNLSFLVALFFFAVTTFLLSLAPHAPKIWGFLSAVGFVLCCAASCLAFLALALRFWERRSPVFASLRANAYGMYLVHYAFASWLQLALLRTALPGLAKGTLVTLGTVVLSWMTVAMLRRVPGVTRVI